MFRTVIVLQLVILPVVVMGQAKSSRNGTPCITPNGETANCTNVPKCQIMMDNMLAKRNETFEFMKKSRCGLEEPPLVCCGSYGNYLNMTTTPAPEKPLPKEDSPLLPDRGVCGKQGIFLDNKIFGGREADLGEFPWMARIIHMNNDYGCVGSLISNNIVLTAAHCVTGEIVTKLKNVDIVRLGEHDIRTTIDCTQSRGIKKCAPPFMDVEIGAVIYHTRYNPRAMNAENDIAILLLKTKVNFTEYVRPICLQRKKRVAINGYYVAGWGTDETGHKTDAKMKLFMPHFDHKECVGKFKTLKVSLTKNHMCAGGEEGEDACTGDSGGPLMSVEGDQWFQEGIVSFGRNCGEQGWPGIYTKINRYHNWIKKAIRKAYKVFKSDEKDLIVSKT